LAGQPKTAPASPAACEDLSGLPPTWIGCGALDLFLPEDLEYAERLINAGVDTTVNVYPGTIHAFQALPDIEMTRRFHRDYREAIARSLL
jgi:triacylglycerol lipase